VAIQLARWSGLKVFATASRTATIDWCKKLGADVILNHRNNLYNELKATGNASVDAIFCTTHMETHWHAMAECIRPQGRIVLIDDPIKALDITISWEFMYTRSMFETDDMPEQGRLLSMVAGLLDEGTLFTTRP
jgi:NADPH:quinone reductase